MEDLRSRGAKLGRCNCDQPRVSRAGEVTLARFGVLMLDELPEFRVSTIEGARMRLDHMGATAPFVVATMNPCPCGWRGYTERQCTCSDASIRHYTERAWKVALALGLDAASDDRIEMPAVSLDTLRRAQPARCKPGAWYRARIAFDRGWRSWCMRDERPDDPDVARGWDAAAQTNERSYVKPMLDEGPGVFEAEAAALGVAS
ncbi:MAG TPA: ATP-binding protein, partial [Acidimicrobiales bacterium]